MTARIGMKVQVRDAFGQLLPGRLARVPEEWRDGSGSIVRTNMGAFPKHWIEFAGGDVVPWPCDAVSEVGG